MPDSIDKVMVKDLSDNELAIMQSLWDLGRTNGRAIFAAFPRPLAYTTILTYLKRLEMKGYVLSFKEGRINEYQAQISREAVIERMLQRLTGLVQGKFAPLMQHHLETGGKVDHADIEQAIDLAKSYLRSGTAS